MDCSRFRSGPQADRELSMLARLLLRWHRLGCPRCRAERVRTEEIGAHLRRMAEEPATDALRERILAAFPASTALPAGAGGEKANLKMRRWIYVVACASLLVLVTGAFAARFFFRPSFGCSDRLGRNWHITGDFHGQVVIFDAKGDLGAVFSNGFGAMTEPVVISTSNETRTVQGPGKHVIRGKDGTLYGYALLRALSEQEYLASRWVDRLPGLAEGLDAQAKDWANPNWDTHGGATGTETAAWGVRGFDTAAGLRWRVLGTGRVSVFDGTGKELLAEGHTTPLDDARRAALPESLRRLVDAEEPELFVHYAGKEWSEKGYGRHALKDEGGRIRLVVEIRAASQ